MTPTEALNQAQSFYKEMTGPAINVEEIPTHAEKVKAIVEIARHLISGETRRGKGQFCEQCGAKLSQGSSLGESN